MYVCMYGQTYSKSMDQPCKIANPACGQLNWKNEHFPVRVYERCGMLLFGTDDYNWGCWVAYSFFVRYRWLRFTRTTGLNGSRLWFLHYRA